MQKALNENSGNFECVSEVVQASVFPLFKDGIIPDDLQAPRVEFHPSTVAILSPCPIFPGRVQVSQIDSSKHRIKFPFKT